MEIIIVPREQRIPAAGISTAYLHVDRWNDFSFITMFYMYLFDQKGERHDIGNVKIGFQGQTTEKSTYSTLGSRFRILPEGYFSVGQDVDYYQKISNLPESVKVSLLEALKDIAYAPELIDLVKDEEVFKTSLLRYVSLSVIKGQFARVLEGKNPLTNFEFKFIRPAQDKISDIELSFKVKVGEKPSTNIHAIIGRNGVGKTTILNGMIEAVTSKGTSNAKFYDLEGWSDDPIDNDYFSSLVALLNKSNFC
ncbi:hypothetical protein ACM2MS_20590 [Escherichia coli]